MKMARLSVGQRVITKPAGYYSGEGVIKSIQRLRQQSTPTSKITIREMVAVYFVGKGTVWFNKADVKVVRSK
jgi:hypothetical protein